MENVFEADLHEDSHPSDYGFGGFDSWEDFHKYCDTAEKEARLDQYDD